MNAAFEEWPLPAEPFDLVIAATSFHWLDPAVRTVKSASALRPGGSLAIISTHHIAGGDTQFFADVQSCYERWMPGTPTGLRLPAAADVPSRTQDLEGNSRFGQVRLRRYERDLTYTTREYLDLLLSYSGHRALQASPRRALLACIAQLIDDHLGGRVTKRYMTALAVAGTPRS